MLTFNYFYYGNALGIMINFNYLAMGVSLYYNSIFTRTQKSIASRGRKCMFAIFKICNTSHLNVETKLNVFYTYVPSILNYACEVWSFHPSSNIELVHTDFRKRILHVKKCTPG